jgi:hypothetical protein
VLRDGERMPEEAELPGAQSRPQAGPRVVELEDLGLKVREVKQ